MESLKEEIRNCTKCADLVRSRTQAVAGDGKLPAKILFVGLAPGRNGADITGIPFTKDRSGLLFREALLKSNISNYFVTNIIKCNPKDNMGRNRLPKKEEIVNCRNYLLTEIYKISPEIIITLGKEALEFFLGPINQMREYILKKRSFGGIFLIPFYHPSYIIRGSYKKEFYLRDFLTLRNLIS